MLHYPDSYVWRKLTIKAENKHIEKLSKLGRIFILKIGTVLWKFSIDGAGASNCKMLLAVNIGDL